jgi:hypothetical protein
MSPGSMFSKRETTKDIEKYKICGGSREIRSSQLFPELSAI